MLTSARRRARSRLLRCRAVIYRFADCELDDQLFELRRGGARVAIQPKVLCVLLFLVRERTRAVDRRELLRAVWSVVKVADDSVTRAILEARRAIGDDAHEMIVTLRGVGFRFAAPVMEVSAGGASLDTRAFIGREGSLSTLRAHMKRAFSGAAGAAAIAGDAGIGKTRLAEEVAAIARSAGALVLVVRMHETPASPPFWPWTQLVSELAERRGDDVAELAGRASALLTASRGEDFPTFHAVVRLFQRLAASGPVMILLDDAHWADEGSLLLLRFLVREARDARIFVVWTYRDGGLADGRARALGAALRESGGAPVPLEGLTRDQTARLVFELKGRQPSPELASAIHERTAGSPLFVRQVLETEWASRALAEQARSVATSIDLQNAVRASLERHLDGISSECRDLLVSAAVLGKDFDFASLSASTRLGSQMVLDRLEEAVRARLVNRRKDGRYAFVLPLVGEALYKQLGAAERAERHRAAGEGLETLHRDVLDLHAARIAHHFCRAAPVGVARQAFAYSVRAARHAEVQGDARAAVKLWEQALRVLELVPESAAERLDALLSLARCRSLAGDAEGARQASADASALEGALRARTSS